MNLLQNNESKVEGKQGILKVPLVRVGRWAHKAARIIQFSLSDLKQLIQNFRDDVLQHKPYLTYGHVLEPYSSDSHRKKGDLIDMAIENDVLYGYFKANPSTYESVLNGDYEFASVEYVRDHIDPKTGNNVGMVLLRTALTNSPFLPGDIKIEALSQNSKSDRLFTTIPIVNKKNINMKDNSNTQNLSNTATLEREDTQVNQGAESSPQQVSQPQVQETTNTQEIANTGNVTQNAQNTQATEESVQQKDSQIALLLKEISDLKKQMEEGQSKTELWTQKVLEEVNSRLSQSNSGTLTEEKEVKEEEEVEDKGKGEENKKKEEKDEPKVLSNTDDKEIKPEGTEEVSQEESVKSLSNNQQDVDTKMSNSEINKYIGSKNTTTPLDIQSLVKNIRDRVSSAYSAQLKDSQATVQSLQQQLNELKNTAEQEKRQRELYALSLQEAQQQAFLASTDLTRDHLIGNGVPPELANQFIQVQSGFLTNQDKINLSLDGQEPKEMDITEALCELFIRAVSCSPVNLSVSGQTSFGGGAYDPTGRTQRIREVIERNRKRAQELYK